MATDFTKYGAPSTSPSGTDFNKYGKPVAQSNLGTESKEDGLLKSIIKAPLKSLIVKPAVRTYQAATALPTYIFGSEEEKLAMDRKLAKDVEFDIPVLGKMKVETVKPGTAGLKQVAGEALESGSYLVGGGGAAGAAKTAAKQTVKQLTKEGAKIGFKSGAMYGAGEGLQKDESVPEIIKSTAIGAGFGAGAGAAIPLAFGGASKVINKTKNALEARTSRIAQKEAERATMIKSGVPEAEIATKKLVGGRVIEDKIATEAVRQGIPEADVALIKSGSNTDAQKMLKMLDIREKQLSNKRIVDRATDVVGDTFLDNAKFIESKNKEAAKKLDMVAQRLAGKKADVSKSVTSFAESLERSGIRVNKNGTLNFKGSDFEGLRAVQQSIVNVWNRALRIARSGDALQIHRAKSFIDNIVEYGAEGKGLSGKAERLLKTFRHDIDTALDTKFKTYNQPNTIFADTIGELNKISQAMGRRFKLGDSFAGSRAGVTMRRILSNTQSRTEILQLLDSMQKIAMKYGKEIDDDIITQANFADLLEKVLGSEAPSSFLGQIEKGVNVAQEVGSIVQQAGRSPTGAAIRAISKGVEMARGINQQNKMKALRSLLEDRIGSSGSKGGSKKSVFGKARNVIEEITPTDTDNKK